jgi:hypothetical protein
MSVRAEILAAAAQAVTVDRAATHGEAERSFAQIAALWSVRLGAEVTPEQVAILLVDLKTVRAWGNPGHFDNWIDIAGYAACGGEVAKLRWAFPDDPTGEVEF